MAWSYSDRVSPERQARLLSAPDFEVIANRIVGEVTIMEFEIIRGTLGEAKGCLRPQFSLAVGWETFDLFHNSPCGYRGMYHRSPDTGLRTNADLIARLTDRLLAFANGRTTKHVMQTEAVRQSLAGESAKIWIDEQGARTQRGHDILELRADLLVEPWLKAAQSYVANPAAYPDPAQEVLAVDGVKAPTGTMLEVKGAFLDKDGNECVPTNKIDRAQQIHSYGFT